MNNKYIVGFVVFLIYILPSTKWWYLSQSYHVGVPLIRLIAIFCSILFVCICILAFALGVLWPIARKLPHGEIIARTLIITPIIIGVVRAIKNLFIEGVALPLAVRIGLVIVSILLSYLFALGIQSKLGQTALRAPIFKRAALAFVGGFLIFHLSGFIQRPIFEVAPSLTIFNVDNISALGVKNRNVLFLVLDELSVEGSKNLESTIKQFDLPYRMEVINAPTNATIQAIPTLLTGVEHHDMHVCGSTTICGKAQKLDFSKLILFDKNTDVVGIYHPYCSINGLRSCFASNAFFRTPVVDFFCSVLNFQSFGSAILPCIEKIGTMQERTLTMVNSVNQMPFWEQGGLLYIHLPIPHPWLENHAAKGAREALDIHYQEKIVLASDVIKDLLNRLTIRFGNDFIFVITTDHSLRTDLWCKSTFACAHPNPTYSYDIPFIVISPTLKADAAFPKSQLEIFKR